MLTSVIEAHRFKDTNVDMWRRARKSGSLYSRRPLHACSFSWEARRARQYLPQALPAQWVQRLTALFAQHRLRPRSGRVCATFWRAHRHFGSSPNAKRRLALARGRARARARREPPRRRPWGWRAALAGSLQRTPRRRPFCSPPARRSAVRRRWRWCRRPGGSERAGSPGLPPRRHGDRRCCRRLGPAPTCGDASMPSEAVCVHFRAISKRPFSPHRGPMIPPPPGLVRALGRRRRARPRLSFAALAEPRVRWRGSATGVARARLRPAGRTPRRVGSQSA